MSASEFSATSCLMMIAAVPPGPAAHSLVSLTFNFPKIVCSEITVQEWLESRVLVLMLYPVVRLQCTV